MRLADFIQSNTEPILREWEGFARTLQPAPGKMTSKQLRDHASAMLRTIADDLRVLQTSEQQALKSQGGGVSSPEDEAGRSHGIARLDANFSIEQIVSEYRALRASVLRLWSEGNKSLHRTDMQDMTRFNEAIDQLLAASVSSFAQKSRKAVETEQLHRDEFLAMLAHELRNPLAPLRSAAQLLKLAKGDTAVASKTSDIIERQVEHMAVLIEDLLDVSRVTRGLIELQQGPVDMGEVIGDAVEQVLPMIEGRHQQLTVRQVTEPAVVRGDHNRLVQVVSNLLHNAAKYSPEGGHILAKTAADAERVTLTVEDDGIGMPSDLIEHLFEPFVQARRTSDRSSGGLGLGLTLVKRLVELQKGTVTVSSPGLGKGSTFTVALPRLHGHDADVVHRRRTDAGRGQPADVPRDAPRSLRVLVVDDNVDAAQMLYIILNATGYDVIVEHGARRALDVARDQHPDVCVLDIGLPDMDGKELARQLRASPETADIKLIALTGYGQPSEREQALAAGFDFHVTKPVDTGTLLSLLQTQR